MDVVKWNIEEFGGYIEVELMFGKGSYFIISLLFILVILDG